MPAPPSPLTPEDGLEKIRSLPQGRTVLLDFDLTLFLVNSTETYLARLPGPVKDLVDFEAKVLSKAMENRRAVRDWVRLLLATGMCPWLPFLWRRAAPELALAHLNRPLAEALAARPDLEVVVVSIGFEGLIAPVLGHMPLNHQGLVACGWLSGGEQRASGKLEMVRRALGEDRVAASVVITDSDDDRPLLEAADIPVWIKWPEAHPLPRKRNDTHAPG